MKKSTPEIHYDNNMEPVITFKESITDIKIKDMQAIKPVKTTNPFDTEVYDRIVLTEI